MKAIAYTRWGPPEVLQLQDAPQPVLKENQVLVRVHASSVNAMEWRLFTFPRFFLAIIGGGFRAPRNKSLGGDLAGRVEAVGSAVKHFRPGDEVFGLGRGAFAEYVCTVEEKLARKPPNLSFEAAASVPVAALTALQGLRNQGKIQAGQRVLIQGAGGGVGTFAVQIAKAFDTEVTAVCSTRNLDVVRSLGADHVIDYTKEDFTKSGELYDLILAANGYHPILDYRRALSPNGVYVVVGGAFAQMLQALFVGTILNWFGSKRFRGMICRPTQEDLEVLSGLLESGKVMPAIDRCYPLSKLPEAIRYLMNGHAQGKVVITVAQPRAESAPTSAH